MDAQKTGGLIAQARKEKGLTQRELAQRERMIAQTARTDDVYLCDLTVGDGRTNLQVQLELWTETGLGRIWPLAEITDGAMPRHQTLAFAYEMRESEEVMALGVTLESGDGFRGTWSAMVKDLPRMEWGYYMDPLDEHCTLDPEYGAVLACWSLPTEETVHQGANGQMRVDYIPPEWTGAVEEPQVEAGECFLLLRLLVQ